MSFSKIGNVKVRDIKPRCGRCGKTLNVRTVNKVDLCAACRKQMMDPHYNEWNI